MKKIRFLFINLFNPRLKNEKSYFPLSISYLISYVNKYLKNANLIEFSMINDCFEENIKKIKPDIIGITCVSQYYGWAKKISDFSKKIGIKHVIIGGIHISLHPESLSKNMDIGVIKEGEQTFLELMKLFLKYKSFPPEKLNLIKGIAYWDKKKLKITQNRELIKDIDKIPFPDRSLFKIDTEEAYMFSSRGCPYKCVFCASSRLWETTRFHSAEYVFNEIKELVNKYDVKRIHFGDDLFIANKKRVKKLVELLEKENLIDKVDFHVGLRANLVDDDICKLLKRMNVKSINMGLESGSPQVLKYLKGDSVTVEDNFNAVELIKKYGINNCFATFIIGSPIDTKETILETLNFIKKSKLDSFSIFILTPLPGTPMWEYAKKQKLIPSDLNNFNWELLGEGFEVGYPNIHLAKNLSKKELNELFKKFILEKKKRFVYMAFRTLIFNPLKAIKYIKKRI
ncbi:MAG: radical SAM protein [Candidatus Nanoarchaeia archaeon]|nr:radical SAM protein [Candidatus Nanoarchaeia archaeon]